jgi:aryl-alcohol dehydrogenase-like predicted oxidoreductase
MEKRKFGNTDLQVSEIGFGAWGIGGPSMAKEIPIGWGEVNDDLSKQALKESFDRGINFYDTADFYGLGHSEKLIGEVFGNSDEVVVATKVGHRLGEDSPVILDYSKEHILNAAEQSLKRLKREAIDYYQLHSAKVSHLEEGECVEAMEKLQKEGKIRYWGISLNTFHPEPEAEFFFNHNIGNGFQLVLNIINQRAVKLLSDAKEKGYGVIARMPIQFGLLTGKFDKNTRFEKNDHRYFRLTPDVLSKSLDYLEDVWPIAEKYNTTKGALALSFILSFPEVSTVIPGIKTPEQAEKNTSGLVKLEEEDKKYLQKLYDDKFEELLQYMEENG